MAIKINLSAKLRHELQCIIAANSTVQSYPCRSSKCQQTFAKPPKQRKGLRTTIFAFVGILKFVKRMTDVVTGFQAEKPSIAEAEHSQTASGSPAERKDNTPIGLHVEPGSPSLSSASEYVGSCHDAGSPLSPLSSEDDFDMPPTPRLRTCALPMSPSIVISPLRPLPPLQSHSPHRSGEASPGTPGYDPFDDDPLLRPLAEDWSSLDRNSALSLTAEPPEPEPWPYNNALGLYVDPAMNVTTWDAGGFIRSTAPSPSPTRFAGNTRRS